MYCVSDTIIIYHQFSSNISLSGSLDTCTCTPSFSGMQQLIKSLHATEHIILLWVTLYTYCSIILVSLLIKCAIVGIVTYVHMYII